MLFDLRSRRRRHAVRVIYILLAVIMLAGLVLVGVGTGNSNGGLLNAFTNNGSGGSGNQVINQEVTAAIKAVKKDPSPANWYALMGARWASAQAAGNYNATTGAYSKSGDEQLKAAVIAWNDYLSAAKQKPDEDASILAAKLYQALAQWKNAAVAWQDLIYSQPAGSSYDIKGYECVALNSYAAGDTATGSAASTRALAVMPKIDKLTWKSDVKQAAASKSTASTYVTSLC